MRKHTSDVISRELDIELKKTTTPVKKKRKHTSSLQVLSSTPNSSQCKISSSEKSLFSHTVYRLGSSLSSKRYSIYILRRLSSPKIYLIHSSERTEQRTARACSGGGLTSTRSRNSRMSVYIATLSDIDAEPDFPSEQVDGFGSTLRRVEAIQIFRRKTCFFILTLRPRVEMPKIGEPRGRKY